MARMVLQGEPGTASDDVISVADLLSRHACPAGPTPSVSVGSLLRREGRAPHAVDRPVQPRRRELAARRPATGPSASRFGPGTLRRGAIATGALIAVGSAIGAAALTRAALSDVQEPQPTSDPGQGGLRQSGGAPAGTQPDALIDPTTVIGALDPGSSVPTSWMAVAFPSTTPGLARGSDADRPADTAGIDPPASGTSRGDDRERGTPAAGPSTPGPANPGRSDPGAPGAGAPGASAPGPGTTGPASSGSGSPAAGDPARGPVSEPGRSGRDPGVTDPVGQVERALPDLRQPVGAVTGAAREVGGVTGSLTSGLLG